MAASQATPEDRELCERCGLEHEEPIPLPWHTLGGWVGNEVAHRFVCSIDGLMCQVERKGYAELIVKAVNAHDDLVAGMRNLMRYMEAFIETSNGEMPGAKALVIRARTLLASLEPNTEEVQ